MSPLTLVTITFVVLTVIAVPLFASIGLTTALALHLIDIPYTLLAQVGFTALQPFPLLSIPLFVLAGRLMEVGGMSTRLIDIAKALAGGYRGSLGIVTVFACMLFAALSGSGPATTAAIGSVMIPAMRRDGYSARFAGAVSAAGGALGSLIPPSNLMIIYGLVSQTSIPRLFMAGFLPGFIVTAFLMIASYIVTARHGYGRIGTVRFGWRPLLRALWDGKFALGAPLVILGGIYSGVFTPTEAAGVAVFYALFVGIFVFRELTVAKIVESLRFTALISGLMILLPPAIAFGQLAAFYDMPDVIQSFTMQFTTSAVMVLVVIGVFYIFIGTFMESLAQIILFTPVFLPLVLKLGIDPVMFGILTVVTCEIGFLTPPVGANLNVAARIARVSIEAVSVAVLPFIVAYIAGLLVIILFPQVSLFLPNLMYGVSR